MTENCKDTGWGDTKDGVTCDVTKSKKKEMSKWNKNGRKERKKCGLQKKKIVVREFAGDCRRVAL